MLQMIGLDLTFLIEGNLSLSMGSIPTMLCLNMEFPRLFTSSFFLDLYHDLNKVIKYCKVHHFADDANLLHFNTSTKKT